MNSLDFMSFVKKALFSVAAIASGAAFAANPILPLWEYIPDGEPYVFDDPDNPGKMRVYLYGSRGTVRGSSASGTKSRRGPRSASTSTSASSASAKARADRGLNRSTSSRSNPKAGP